MKTFTCMMLAVAAMGACGYSPDGRGEGGAGSDSSSSGESGTLATTTAGTSPSTSASTTVGTTASTSDTATTGDDSTGDDPFEFEDDPPEAYTQVDRMGMPAVATALIMTKDDYNQATPSDDANADFVPQIVDSLTALHAALDDDLVAAGLTPCIVDTCAAQGAPLVVPDVLRIDLGGTSGFPNGRRLEDPVIDITLAVILLDLEEHGADTLAAVPINPPANEADFLAEFPYMAAPH